jgi:hypothetical protein
MASASIFGHTKATPYSSTPIASTPSAFIEEDTAPVASSSTAVGNMTIPMTAVAAVLPSSSQTFALGEGSDSDYSVSPISVPHFFWKANVFGCDEFPLTVDCLLDNGAHIVLIRPETVTDLALPIRKLHEPIRVSVALQNSNSLSETFLENYVTLSLSSLNNAWSSRPI